MLKENLKLINENGLSYDLNANEISIGRSYDNTITVMDMTVSAYHAKIYTYMSVCYVEDLNSSNGTFVNNKRIQKHILYPGDTLKLGDLKLKLTHD